jgi:hypothetical protein
MTDRNIIMLGIVFGLTYFAIFRLVTSRYGYVWINRKQYNELTIFIDTLVKQNENYKRIMATNEHFPTEAKDQTLFNLGKVPKVNGQRYTIQLSNGLFSLPYAEFMNHNKGLIKVERTLYQRDSINNRWHNKPTTKTLWINEQDLCLKETYSKDKLQCWQDKQIDLDWRKESENAPQYSQAQLELIK